jgi:molybdate transport system regulatory protein
MLCHSYGRIVINIAQVALRTMPASTQHEPSGKIWIEYRGKPLLGKGGAEILIQIDRGQSLSMAAKKLGMSYRYLWGYLRKVERALGKDVVETYKGGKTGGGGARLTKVGRGLLDEYMRLEEFFNESLASSKREEARGSKTGVGGQLKGEVVTVEGETTTAKVMVQIEAPTVITTIITRRALRNLGLKVGDNVEVTIKSADIAVAE